MTIEVGDTVQIKGKIIFAGLTVLKIEGDQALCSYFIPDNDSKGDERPVNYVTVENYFPLEELTITRKNH